MSVDQQEKEAERVLYGFWISPYMAQVAQLLIEAGLDFRYERVSPYVGATHTDKHKAKNPLAKIPSFKDSNGQYVSDSQAICRYISRMYPEARKFYPSNDPIKCSEVDAKNDFITFSISGPFFNCFVFGAYFPKAFKLKLEKESQLFSMCSLFLIKGALDRLIQGSRLEPFLLGSTAFLPDFQLFQILELSRTFAKIFDMPFLNLVEGNQVLQRFYDAMSSRPSTQKIVRAQASELDITKRELFEEFGAAYENILRKDVLQSIFGHEV